MPAYYTAEYDAYRYQPGAAYTEPAVLLWPGRDVPVCTIVRDPARAHWLWNCYALGYGWREDVWVHPSAPGEFTAWIAHHDPLNPDH